MEILLADQGVIFPINPFEYFYFFWLGNCWKTILKNILKWHEKKKELLCDYFVYLAGHKRKAFKWTFLAGMVVVFVFVVRGTSAAACSSTHPYTQRKNQKTCWVAKKKNVIIIIIKNKNERFCRSLDQSDTRSLLTI